MVLWRGVCVKRRKRGITAIEGMSIANRAVQANRAVHANRAVQAKRAVKANRAVQATNFWKRS